MHFSLTHPNEMWCGGRIKKLACETNNLFSPLFTSSSLQIILNQHYAIEVCNIKQYIRRCTLKKLKKRNEEPDPITYLSLKPKEPRPNHLTFAIINGINNLQQVKFGWFSQAKRLAEQSDPESTYWIIFQELKNPVHVIVINCSTNQSMSISLNQKYSNLHFKLHCHIIILLFSKT